jgi:hypothetical protein
MHESDFAGQSPSQIGMPSQATCSHHDRTPAAIPALDRGYTVETPRSPLRRCHMNATQIPISDTALIAFVIIVFVLCVLLCGFVRIRDVGDLWHVEQRDMDE